MFVKSNILSFSIIKYNHIHIQNPNATIYHQAQQKPQQSIASH
jgi:hypothetical protein